MELKRIFFINVILFSSIFMNAQTVKVDKLPATIDEFLKLRNNIATTPEGGATIFLIALKTYAENPELGKQFLVIAADRGSLQAGSVYKGFALGKSSMQLIKSQMTKNKKIPNSYIQGSNPENGYSVKAPFEYKYKSNPYSGDPAKGLYKIFVFCSGADSARPITLKRNNKGFWKASNWSSVLTGIKKEPVSDDL